MILSSNPVNRRACLGINGLERPRPVARHLDRHRPVVGQDGLAAAAIPMMGRVGWPGLSRGKPEVLAEFSPQNPVDDRLLEPPGGRLDLGRRERALAPTRSSKVVYQRASDPPYHTRRSRLQRNSGGFAPANPPTASLAGPSCPAPLRRLVRSCSLVSWPRGSASLGELLVPIERSRLVPSKAQPPKEKLGGLRPREPPYGVARGGPPAPLRSADSLASARSFHDDGVERSSVSNSYLSRRSRLVPIKAKPPRTKQGEAASYQARRSRLVPSKAKPPRTKQGEAASYRARRSRLVPSKAKPPRTKQGEAASYQARRSRLVPSKAKPPRTFFKAKPPRTFFKAKPPRTFFKPCLTARVSAM